MWIRNQRNDLKETPVIYQLKITLSDSRPPIWRRVEVEGSISLGQLHGVIQIVMGWTNSHLHQFIADGTSYGMVGPELDDWGMEMLDENKITLEQIASGVGVKFGYEYDFGDGWEHLIQVEQVKEPEADIFYPICLAGKRACPPEDVGGIWGYEDFLKALQDRNHPEHEEYLQWIGGRFDPEYFNLEAVNRILARLDFYRVCKREKSPTYTPKQGQYLAFIYYYTKLNGFPPAQADIQQYFRVTPPTVNNMLKTLEKRGPISRVPRQPRSIKLLLLREELPDLE